MQAWVGVLSPPRSSITSRMCSPLMASAPSNDPLEKARVGRPPMALVIRAMAAVP